MPVFKLFPFKLHVKVESLKEFIAILNVKIMQIVP